MVRTKSQTGGCLHELASPMLRTGIRFLAEIILWLLLQSLYRIHVPSSPCRNIDSSSQGSGDYWGCYPLGQGGGPSSFGGIWPETMFLTTVSKNSSELSGEVRCTTVPWITYEVLYIMGSEEGRVRKPTLCLALRTILKSCRGFLTKKRAWFLLLSACWAYPWAILNRPLPTCRDLG